MDIDGCTLWVLCLLTFCIEVDAVLRFYRFRRDSSCLGIEVEQDASCVVLQIGILYSNNIVY